jgi:flagellar hook-associated protein 2
MAASLNVDGLVSGLDTSTIITQLMALEKQPQDRLVAKRDATNRTAELYRQLNTRFNAVETAADKLSAALDWRVTKATSSDADAVSVTSTGNAPVGNLSFRVNVLAAAHSVISSGAISDPTQAGQLTAGFVVNGVTITDIGDGSLNSVAAAINASTAGVTASVIRIGATSYKLQLTAKGTGEASAFTVSGSGLEALGTVDQVVTQGRDAVLTVGDTTPYTITSATNTVTGVIAGVTLSLRKADPTATIEVGVAADAEKLADMAAALVTSVNDATTFVRTNSTYNASTRAAGAFLGDQVATRLSSALVIGATDGVGGATIAPKTAGISVSRDGVLSFDRAAFLAAYAADPAALETLFVGTTPGTGLAARLEKIGHDATDTTTGSITAAVAARVSAAKTLTDQITNWDARLSLKEQTLRRQFTALETAMSQARNQSQWLAGQIASLPTRS